MESFSSSGEKREREREIWAPAAEEVASLIWLKVIYDIEKSSFRSKRKREEKNDKSNESGHIKRRRRV